MRRVPIFLLLFFPVIAFCQSSEWEEQARRVELRQANQERRVEIRSRQQQDRLWKQMNGEREARQPQRSVAAMPSSIVSEPTYTELTEADPSVARTSSRTISAQFLGEYIQFNAEYLPPLGLGGQINQQSITRAYQTLEANHIPVLLTDLKRHASQRNLNDWGYLQWVHSVTGSMYPGDQGARTIATAWIMQKSGYRATVSYSGQQVNLLVETRQKLYGHSFLNVSGTRMYVVNPLGEAPDIRSAHLFDPPQSRSGRPLDLRITEPPTLNGELHRRQVSFQYFDRTISGEVEVNRRVAQFYYRYPLVDWSVYVGAPISEEALASIRSVLDAPLASVRPRAGWTREMEQANLILHFIQQAFPYRSDGESLGREHYAFAEEMLALPYSDCEDRSALYITLVRELLGLEAVGLLFPGHAAVGVNFGPGANGDKVHLEGSTYLVCDPSYLGANIGMALPQVNGRDLTVIGR